VVLVRNFQKVVRHDAKDKSEPPYEKYNYYTHSVDLTRLYDDKGWKR
jgi:hypothetical protein